MTTRPTPKFTGIDTYRDSLGRFQFRFPMDWHAHKLADKREGILYSPQDSNPQTWFAVWITDLKEQVVAEDLHVLRQGLDKGLADLKDCHVEVADDTVMENLIKFERIFTFREGQQTRKWRQWLLYVDRWLMVVTYQGESPEEYDYWYAMVNHSFLNFNIAEALWFAVDRDLARLNKPTSPSETSAEG